MANSPDLDVNAIRKANLRRLIQAAGSLTTFADKVEVNPDYLSSILSDKTKRNAGDTLMRRVETRLGLRFGSLDFPGEQSIAAAMAISSLPSHEQHEVFNFIKYKLETSSSLTARENVAHYLKVIEGFRTKTMPPKTKK